MMKRNLIALALLCILVMAFLVTPVVAAGLSIVDGASISATDGATSPVITIKDAQIAKDDTIWIDISNLHQVVDSFTFTTDNVVVSDTALDATWTGDVAGDTLTLTSACGAGDSGDPATCGITNIDETVTLTLTGATNIWSIDPTGPWTITLTATRTDGNGDGTFDFVTVPPPTFSSAETTTDGTIVLVTFDKDMGALPAAPAGFTVTVNGADNVVSGVALNADNKIIELTLTTPVAVGTDVVRVTYAPGTVTSADTGVLAGFGPSAVTNNVLAPPTFSSAETTTDGTKVLVTFDKDMGALPAAPAGFTVTVNGAGDVVSGVALNVDNKIIELTLTTPIAASTDVVRVTYAPGTVTSADTAVLAGFGPSGVTNNLAPTVTGITPASGSDAGGTVVTVTGTGFTGATVVNFGAKVGTALTVDSNTQITITSPDGAAGAVVHVTVTTPGGTSATSDADRFTYATPPSVTGIVPDTGINAGPVSVTITGTDFVNGATVKLTKAGQADILATNVVWVSATQITCDLTITGAAAGDWTVVVTNPDTQNSLNGPNNPLQLVGLAIANQVSNAASDNTPSRDPGDSAGTGNTPGAGTGQSTAPAEPGVQEAPASPAATGSVTAELSINDQGVISQSTELQSPDGRASVSIDAGVVALDQAGAPVSSVSIDTLGPSDMPDVPQGGAVSFAGIAYELGPNGAQFSPAISITFAAPPGQVGQDFTVRTYDHVSDTWQDLPTSYDPQTGTVTAEVSHFCCFALFAKTVTTAPAIAATIAATPVLTPLIPTTIAPPSPTIATTFLGIVLWVVNLMISNPLVIAGIAILVVGIVLIVWKQRRDRLNFRP